MARSWARGGLDQLLGKLLHRKNGQTLEEVAQRSDGITTFGSVQKTCRWGT